MWILKNMNFESRDFRNREFWKIWILKSVNFDKSIIAFSELKEIFLTLFQTCVKHPVPSKIDIDDIFEMLRL